MSKNLQIRKKGIDFLTDRFKIEEPKNFGIRMDNNDIILIGSGKKREEHETGQDTFDKRESIMFEKYQTNEISWHQYNEFMIENKEDNIAASFRILHLNQEDANFFRKQIIRKDGDGNFKSSKRSSQGTKATTSSNVSVSKNVSTAPDPTAA